MSLAKGHMSVFCQNYQRASLILLGQFELYFICSLLANGESKFIFLHPGHMTRSAAMPIHRRRKVLNIRGGGKVQNNVGGGGKGGGKLFAGRKLI